jgi:hypothetical protein
MRFTASRYESKDLREEDYGQAEDVSERGALERKPNKRGASLILGIACAVLPCLASNMIGF